MRGGGCEPRIEVVWWIRWMDGRMDRLIDRWMNG